MDWTLLRVLGAYWTAFVNRGEPPTGRHGMHGANMDIEGAYRVLIETHIKSCNSWCFCILACHVSNYLYEILEENVERDKDKRCHCGS